MSSANDGTWSATGTRWGVLVALLIAATSPVSAAPVCTLAGVGAFAVTADGLRVVESATPALQRDDVLLQLNDRRLRTCDDASAALNVAEQQGLVPVVLVRRGDATRTATLPWPPTPPEIPAPASLTAPDPDSLAEMASVLQAFADQVNLPILSPQPFTGRLRELRQSVRAHRDDAAAGAVEPILAYYDTVAEILAYKENATADAPAVGDTHVPMGGARVQRHALAPFKYTSDGPPATWIARYPFLQSSVTQDIDTFGPFERTGSWQPDEAIRLLVARARADTAALAQRGRSPAR